MVVDTVPFHAVASAEDLLYDLDSGAFDLPRASVAVMMGSRDRF